MKSFDRLLSGLVTILFLIIIPLYLKHNMYKLNLSAKKKYELNHFAWIVEQERIIHTELINDNYNFEFFDNEKNSVTVESFDVVLPSTVKYIKITCDTHKVWVIFE